MPKKTWIDKTDEKTAEIAPVSQTKTLENEDGTFPKNPRHKKKDSGVVFELNPVNLESVKNGLTNNGKMKVELTEDEIVKAVAKRKKRVVVVKKRDDNGNLLKKDGTIDKRPETAKKNLVNSKVYKRLLENQQIPKKTIVPSIPKPIVEDESDSDTDFELEEVKPTKVIEPKSEPEPEPAIIVKRKVTSTEMYLREQEAKRERELQEQMAKMKQMEEENNKLKNRFVFNDHLNRLTHLSTTMKIKY